nr:hypothetical protein [Ruminococcus sp.]
MIRVSNIRVPLDFDFTDIMPFCARKLDIPESHIKSLKLSKKSVDARKKSDVHFIISVDISTKGEKNLLKRLKNSVRIEENKYNIPVVSAGSRPVVVGFGPAGMFAALVLAYAGAEPIVLERGQDVDRRVKS